MHGDEIAFIFGGGQCQLNFHFHLHFWPLSHSFIEIKSPASYKPTMQPEKATIVVLGLYLHLDILYFKKFHILFYCNFDIIFT